MILLGVTAKQEGGERRQGKRIRVKMARVDGKRERKSEGVKG